MPAQGHFPGAAGPNPAPGYLYPGPIPALEAGGENEIDFVCCAEGGREEKYAPEIRDISHTARNQASLILVDVFYRYAAVRPALLPNRESWPAASASERAAIQGLHALSLASLDAIRSNGAGKPPPFQALCALSYNQKRVSLCAFVVIRQLKHKPWVELCGEPSTVRYCMLFRPTKAPASRVGLRSRPSIA